MRLIDKIALGLLLAGVLISTGCGSDKYPTEVSLEDVPDTIAEAFKDEKNANIKALATRQRSCSSPETTPAPTVPSSN
jgi:hypothetical protein